MQSLYPKICGTQHRGDCTPVISIFQLFCLKPVIGRLRILAGDLVLDGSVRGRLEKIRRELEKGG